MEFLQRHRWVRRVLTVTVVVAVAAVLLGFLPVWLILVAFASRFFPGKWRPLRIIWFGFVYALLEVAALVALLWLWLIAGFGTRLDSPASQHRHHRLLAWLLRRVVRSAEFTFGLQRTGDADLLAPVPADRPVVVLSHEAGAGVSLAVLDRVVNGPARRTARVVLKDFHQLDPAVDLLLHRTGGVFVPGGRDDAAVLAAVAQAAERTGTGEALVLMSGDGVAGDDRLLPPRLPAAEAALAALPGAEVAVVGLAGLDGLSTPGEVWRSMPNDTAVVPHAVVAAPGDLASVEQRSAWLGSAFGAVGGSLAAAQVVADRSGDAPTADAAQRVRLVRRLVAPPLWGGVLLALVFWWYSLRPSMLPRTSLIQGVVSAICIAVGVGVGNLVHRAVRRVLRVKRRAVPGVWTERATTVLTGLVLVAVVVGPWRWVRWQQAQRVLVDMPRLSAWSIVPMLLATLVITAVLLGLGRLIAHAVVALDRVCVRLLPAAIARWVALAVVIALVVTGALAGFRQFGIWADQNFGALDNGTDPGVEQPTSSVASGGPGSLVEWDTLGKEGRNFVAGAPTVEQLREFIGGEAMEPVRVYVGLDSAPTTDERVALAVDELRRTGAFDRQVLVVATPTGTGWIDPDAARTIEYMYGGDTAIVGVQYSFLPSWIAFLLDTKSPPVLGKALFDGVYAAWQALPADQRPALVAFGESLGSLGGEAAFAGADLQASIADITARADAALFTGPTRSNPIFGAAVSERDGGSSSWQPVNADEPHLRVANRVSDIVADDSGWQRPRVLYVHHPSDAIGTWGTGTLVEEPGWTAKPAAYDLSPDSSWFPFVTFVQESFDLMNGFSASPGYGHDYRTDFAHAWTMLVPPDGWTVADADRLRAHLGL